MRASLRPAGVVLAVALTGLLAGCGGGFSGGPKAAPDDTIHKYVALGDDFTAAPGVGKSAAEDGCMRSEENYPSLVAKELEVDEFTDVSCVGATTSSFTTETRTKEEGTVPAQLEAVDKDTDLVTIGMGLGDRELLPHAFQICLALPCGDAITPQAILDDVSAMAASLTAAVRTVQDEAPGAYIVIVGYPTITPQSGSCEALPELDQSGLDAANRVLDEVNREARFAARETGIGFLDVARLSTGHELCSGEPWIENSKGKKGARTDYRPAAAEQRAVADGLVALVKNH